MRGWWASAFGSPATTIECCEMTSRRKRPFGMCSKIRFELASPEVLANIRSPDPIMRCASHFVGVGIELVWGGVQV